jgi:hypothetical protein
MDAMTARSSGEYSFNATVSNSEALRFKARARAGIKGRGTLIHPDFIKVRLTLRSSPVAVHKS